MTTPSPPLAPQRARPSGFRYGLLVGLIVGCGGGAARAAHVAPEFGYGAAVVAADLAAHRLWFRGRAVERAWVRRLVGPVWTLRATLASSAVTALVLGALSAALRLVILPSLR